MNFQSLIATFPLSIAGNVTYWIYWYRLGFQI